MHVVIDNAPMSPNMMEENSTLVRDEAINQT